jgi:serine/threonine-protein kinase
MTVAWQSRPRAARDPAATDLYLRARHEYHRGRTENTRRAIALYAQALALAPDDPVLLSGLAMALARHVDAQATAGMETARRAAERAIAMAPELVEPRIALAVVDLSVGEPILAARELRRALSTAAPPADAFEHFGRVLLDIGRIDEGTHALERAQQLEPALSHLRHDIARIHALRGDMEACDALLRGAPTEENAQNLYWLTQTRIALWRRDAERARWVRKTVEPLSFALRKPVEFMIDAILHGRASAEAQSSLGALKQPGVRLRRRLFFLGMAAELLMAVGEEDEALAQLEVAASIGSWDIYQLDRCPLFDRFRSAEHPAAARFATMRARVAARAADVSHAIDGT